jgi:hypothetical protein
MGIGKESDDRRQLAFGVASLPNECQAVHTISHKTRGAKWVANLEQALDRFDAPFAIRTS